MDKVIGGFFFNVFKGKYGRMSVKSIFKDSVTVFLLRVEAHWTARVAMLPVSTKSVVTWSRPRWHPAPHGCNLGLYCIGTLGRNSSGSELSWRCQWAPRELSPSPCRLSLLLVPTLRKEGECLLFLDICYSR